MAAALADFLRPISEVLAVQVALSARLDLTEGRPVMKPSAAEVRFDPQSAMAILLGQIGGLEQRTGHDLGWFRRWLPHPLDEVILRNQLRRLHAIEQLGLWTPSDFARAEMSGAFQSLMGNEVVLTTAGNHVSSRIAIASPGEPTIPSPLAKDDLALTVAEAATLQAATSIVRAGAAEGQATLSYAQRLIVMDTLRRLFGRAPSDDIEKAILASFGGASTIASGSLKELGAEQRQALLTQLAHLAMVDNVISEAEQGILDRIASELEIPPAMTRAILGGDVTGASPEQSESGIICRSCSFDLPLGACFCPACGIAVAAGYG